MLYDVRYQLNGEEQTMRVEAETAATAVEEVHHRLQIGESGFELIQVTLVEEESLEENVLTGK